MSNEQSSAPPYPRTRWTRTALAALALAMLVGCGSLPEDEAGAPEPVQSPVEQPETTSSVAGMYAVIERKSDQLIVDTGLTAEPDLLAVFEEVSTEEQDAGADDARVQIVCTGTATDAVVGKVLANGTAAFTAEGAAATGLGEGETQWEPMGDLTCPPPAVTPVDTAAEPPPDPPTDSAAPATELPAPQPESPSAPDSLSYASCDEARAAGAAPIAEGDPGYSTNLDRDGDGTACEDEG